MVISAAFVKVAYVDFERNESQGNPVVTYRKGVSSPFLLPIFFFIKSLPLFVGINVCMLQHTFTHPKGLLSPLKSSHADRPWLLLHAQPSLAPHFEFSAFAAVADKENHGLGNPHGYGHALNSYITHATSLSPEPFRPGTFTINTFRKERVSCWISMTDKLRSLKRKRSVASTDDNRLRKSAWPGRSADE